MKTLQSMGGGEINYDVRDAFPYNPIIYGHSIEFYRFLLILSIHYTVVSVILYYATHNIMPHITLYGVGHTDSLCTLKTWLTSDLHNILGGLGSKLVPPFMVPSVFWGFFMK